MILLLVQLETIEHARFRALSQIVIDKEKGVEAFEEYMKLAFPYLSSMKRRDKDEALAKLNEAVRQGPLVVTPSGSKPAKSRLKQKVEAAKQLRSDKQQLDLYKKLGPLIPK